MTTPRTTRPQVDEAFEPYEKTSPIPLLLLMSAVALAIWGGLLLWGNRPATPADAEEPPAAQSAPGAQAAAREGAALYAAHCAACHQPDGSGVPGAIPPLAASSFLAAPHDVAASIVLHGMEGPVRVGQDVYDGQMPAFASTLSDAQIATLVAHLRQRFGSSNDPPNPEAVAALRHQAPGRHPWQGGAELAARLAP